MCGGVGEAVRVAGVGRPALSRYPALQADARVSPLAGVAGPGRGGGADPGEDRRLQRDGAAQGGGLQAAAGGRAQHQLPQHLPLA